MDKAGIFLQINPSEGDKTEKDNDDILSELEIFGESKNISPNKNDYSGNSLEELYNKLDEAVQNEDYEKAAEIRDEISKKES